MSNYSNWEPTLIGDKDYCNLKVKEQSNGRYKLMLPTVTRNQDDAMRFAGIARSQGRPYEITANSSEKGTSFAVNAMQMSSQEIEDIIFRYIKNPNSSKNLSVTMREAIGLEKGSDKKFNKVIPDMVQITGEMGSRGFPEIIIYYDIVNAY